MKSWETSAFALAVFVFVERESMLLGPTRFPDCRKPEYMGFAGRNKGGFLVKTAARWAPIRVERWLWNLCTAELPGDRHLPQERGWGSRLCWLWWLCYGGARAQGQLWGLITAASLKSCIAKVIPKVIPVLCVWGCLGRFCSPSRALLPTCGLPAAASSVW